MKKNLILFSLLWLAACNTENKGQAETVNEVVFDDTKEVVCFVYHRFGDSRYPSTNTSLKDFEAHLKYLKDNDFQLLTLSQAIDYLRSHSDNRKTAVITIDDGFASFHERGLPLLKKYNFPATLFINTETVGGNDYMDWAAIKEANKHGIEIGNHTHSHAYFLNQPESERYANFEQELKLTQNLIETNIGDAPTVFAYPYGELDPQMKDIVKRMGFKAAAAQNSGVIYANSDLMQCPRFPMSESYSDISKFASKAKMKALRIKNITPTSFILPENTAKPQLTLNFDAEELRLDQLQCFIQGSACEKILEHNTDSLVELSLKATSVIDQRRRTLYTVTVPDKEGNWHWYSHLWVNSEMK